MKNIDEAMVAAQKRSEHLNKIKDRKCTCLKRPSRGMKEENSIMKSATIFMI